MPHTHILNLGVGGELIGEGGDALAHGGPVSGETVLLEPVLLEPAPELLEAIYGRCRHDP